MLPISLRPDGRAALLVGGGTVAARKAESLQSAGFPVFVVAERIDEPLRAFLDDAGCAYAQRRYAAGDLRGAGLAIAATDDPTTNARIVADARAAKILVCDATVSERGDFTMPATLRVGDLTIGADTAGASPALSNRIVRELTAHFGPEYGDAVRTLRRMRDYVRATFPQREGIAILRALAQRPIAELAAAPPAAVVCATRRSPLATIQCRTIAADLAERGIATRMLRVTTTGDRDRTRPIDRLGASNVFAKELENALRERRADYAVHSCKDLASSLPADVQIAAITRREDPRDAFCSERYASLDTLPRSAVVGTSSARRRTQLLALRPDLRCETLRGNVDTRLRKLRDGACDAIVIAMAGLHRLGARATHVVPFEIESMVPAVGQGALAVEVRAGDETLAAALHAATNDRVAELCVRCERAALRTMHAGCGAPIGIHARIVGDEMVVDGAVEAHPGTLARRRAQRRIATVAEAEAFGEAFGGAAR